MIGFLRLFDLRYGYDAEITRHIAHQPDIDSRTYEEETTVRLERAARDDVPLVSDGRVFRSVGRDLAGIVGEQLINLFESI